MISTAFFVRRMARKEHDWFELYCGYERINLRVLFHPFAHWGLRGRGSDHTTTPSELSLRPGVASQLWALWLYVIVSKWISQPSWELSSINHSTTRQIDVSFSIFFFTQFVYWISSDLIYKYCSIIISQSAIHFSEEDNYVLRTMMNNFTASLFSNFVTEKER